MIFDLDTKSTNEKYKIMAQTIIPRPIAWVVTEDEGIVNIAPFSYFAPLSSTPPAVVISVGHKSDGTPKDTLANLRKNKKCTICIVDEAHLQQMHFSSKELPKESSEMEEFSIESTKVLEDFPPMVRDVPSAYFCEFNQEINLGGATIALILDVKQILVDDKYITNKERLTIDFLPIARIGKSYVRLGEGIEAPEFP